MISPAIAPETIIADRYIIKEFIGEGGMQLVYKALDTSMERVVALKVPKNSSATKRFERSAQLSARVTHPNVAKTLDYIVDGDAQFLIEELVEGADISDALLGKFDLIDPWMGAKVMHQLARGLSASHHVGVVHRDIKPGNIMLSENKGVSSVKVTDFGIAKMAAEELMDAMENEEVLVESVQTNQTLIGALPYMAPEMIEAPKRVDAAADIWAAGAVLYELMTGKKPFGSGLRAVAAIVTKPLPPLPRSVTVNPQFAPLASDLYEIIKLCMQKEPELRPTADELVRLCDSLCYTDSRRHAGRVYRMLRENQGFIRGEDGQEFFFHYESAVGKPPVLNDEVFFCAFKGAGNDRAHPVIKFK